ncbi:TrmH family RNA methyltransferase [Paenibacillus tarimensis]
MHAQITSVQNARVKEWAGLLEKKHREKSGKFLIEGIHLVMEAIAAGADVDCIVYDSERGIPHELKAASTSASGGIEWITASTHVMAKCTGTDTAPPVFAIVRKSKPSHEPLFCTGALVVVMDGIRDPGNAGTIIRSADAVGADAVVLGKDCVDLYNPKTVRSTMGSIFHLPIIEADLATLLPEAKKRGIRLTGTSLQAVKSCYDADWTQSTWLLMGNESNGLSPHAERMVDETVLIPMRGRAESLNVAMAATVLLYEALRQRETVKG